MPKFSDGTDPEEYLSWVLKVDKVFLMHNYPEAKKIDMAFLEFEDYALKWWEQVQNLQRDHDKHPIRTLEEMKAAMCT